MDFIDASLASLTSILSDAGTYALRILLAILVFLAGYVVSKLLRRLSIKLLRAVRTDEMAEKAGLEDFLLKGGVRFTTVTLFAELIYWFVLFITVFLALDILGLDAARPLLSRVLIYLPKVFIAVIILIFASLISMFVSALVHTYLNNVGFRFAKGISALAQIAILLFAIFISLEQLAISEALLVSSLQIILGGLAIAFGVAFGLGGRDAAKQIVDKLYKALSS